MSDDRISVLFDDGEPPAWRIEPLRAPDVVCDGVPTDSVLGLLCALGTLRTLDRAWPDADVRMAWRRNTSAWRPCFWVGEGTLSGETAEKQQQVVQALSEHLTPADAPWWGFADDPKMPSSTFFAKAQEVCATTTHQCRDFADWLVAYGCEGFANKEGEDIKDTDLNVMRKTGQQYSLQAMRDLARHTTVDHLSNALFGGWSYSDLATIRKEKAVKLGLIDKGSRRGLLLYLKLDAREQTDPAYGAFDPEDRDSADPISPILTERGANRLAAEAMPLFATAPSVRSLATVGFFRCKQGTFFRFPLWDRPATVSSLTCLLRHPELTEEVPDAGVLRPLGVVGVVQARRNQAEKGGRSFLPTEQLW